MSSVSVPFSADAGRSPVFTKAGLQLLARRYTTGEFEAHSWGQTHLLDEFWGVEHINTSITPMATTFVPLLAQIICAISPAGTTPAWVLRVVLTPEFLWMGLHQTTFSLMEVRQISPADICRFCPLLATGCLTTGLSFDENWVRLSTAMELWLRADPPATYNIAVGTGDPNDIDMDRPWTPVTLNFPEPLAAPAIIHLPPIITLPPPPTKPKRNWRDGNSGELEIETEEISTKTGPKLGWVSAEYTEYETSSWRPSATGTTSAAETTSDSGTISAETANPPAKKLYRNGVIPFSMASK